MQDADYMRKWYVTEFEEKQAVTALSGRDESERVKKAKANFVPYVLLAAALSCSRADVHMDLQDVLH